MENLKADHHTFQFLKGSTLQHADKPCDLNQIFEHYSAPTYNKFDVISEQLEKIRQYNIAHNMTAFFHPIIGDLNSRKRLEDISILNEEQFRRKLFSPCKFPWSSLHVNYDGEFFPCLSVPLGNIKEKSLKEILHGEAYQNFLSIILALLALSANRYSISSHLKQIWKSEAYHQKTVTCCHLILLESPCQTCQIEMP
jgi:hypothetical protein